MVVAQEDFKKMKTSQLLDKLEELMQQEGNDDYTAAWEEFKTRDPVSWLIEQLDEQEEKLAGMQKALDKLKQHQHGPNGETLVRP